MSLAWDRCSISLISLYGKRWDLYPDFRFVQKGEIFLSFEQISKCYFIWIWSSSTASNLSPSNRCTANAIAIFCSTIILPTLLQNRWDIHHKTMINFFSSSSQAIKGWQIDVNWCVKEELKSSSLISAVINSSITLNATRSDPLITIYVMNLDSL